MLGRPVADALLRFRTVVRRHCHGTNHFKESREVAELDLGGVAKSGGRSAGAAYLEWRCWAGGSAEAMTRAVLGGQRDGDGEWRRAGAGRAAWRVG